MHHTTVCALCEKLREADWEKQTKRERERVCERKRRGRGRVREREELGGRVQVHVSIVAGTPSHFAVTHGFVFCRMIHMHAQLLRRYEKEVKQNMVHTETISELTVRSLSVQLSA